MVVDTEGMSVLTGWAAGKFSGEKVAAAVKASGLESQLEKKRIIIPGYVSQISGEVEEGLPGWEVLVGPGEASDLGSFLKVQAAR
jgi:acetyl-CoA decarbonylase/synthase complex subunit gamma